MYPKNFHRCTNFFPCYVHKCFPGIFSSRPAIWFFFSPAPRGGIFFLPRRANNYPRMCIFFAPPRALWSSSLSMTTTLRAHGTTMWLSCPQKKLENNFQDPMFIKGSPNQHREPLCRHTEPLCGLVHLKNTDVKQLPEPHIYQPPLHTHPHNTNNPCVHSELLYWLIPPNKITQITLYVDWGSFL